MTPYYDEDGITIYHGDCREVMPQLPIRPDAIVSDPPYGIGLKYGEGYNDARADYWDWMREVVEVMRATAPVVAFTHRVAALRELRGWDWVAIWNKPQSFGSRIGNSPVLPRYEPVFLYGIHSLGCKGEMLPDVLTFRPQAAGSGLGGTLGREKMASENNAPHPAPKPLPLYRKLVSVLTVEGGIVCDPFLGSGTTLRAAKDLGRRAIGIEIEERYCELAAQRLAQQTLFGAA